MVQIGTQCFEVSDVSLRERIRDVFENLVTNSIAVFTSCDFLGFHKNIFLIALSGHINWNI